ncbi:rhodanese-like domain-containing protein [Oxynema aestuarii]|jgi:thiosulfate sulfurtransferase|uniref:Rhodanese-like domain-containing protein n=1 Tax=Oxynema aestuarii AP17 TaxID=2064643 RepID=A0A6H1TWX4_9CYAN|nr:rhodanese-like domain-containing protein [Oxynema aestuarii]QIZ70706.1 rhodanese-like domain-containing protein [Oxynema aestuarii AP17]RMH75390.1 MAG: rhodanese-like domain-containing protein [Cyanobacteria bacterium J007]
MAQTKKRKATLKTLTPSQLKSRKQQLEIIDARGFLEYLFGHIPGAKRMSRDRILQELPKDRAIVVTCMSGARSAALGHWLVAQGYQKVYNLQGGCMGWQQSGYGLKQGRSEA